MKKVLFVATVVKTHIMTFHVPYLKVLKEMGYSTAVAARNDYETPEKCVIPYCDTYYDVPFERSPLKPRNLKAYRALKKIVDEGAYDIIHCHTPVGAMLARLAALGARKKGTKVVYTAHGFHFFKGAVLINWLLYFPVEWFLAHFTDVLITINREDYVRAQRFAAKKVYYVPGVGIDTKKFVVDSDLKQAKRQAIRAEFGIPDDATVILSVGEVNKNKNHRVVIEALAGLKDTNIHYIICGRGPLEKSHRALAERHGVEERIHLAGYRNDVVDFYHAADMFVFPSLREGLPVAVMEAMASGLPIVCSRIRGNSDLIVNGKNGLMVDEGTPKDYEKALRQLLDEKKRCEISAFNVKKAAGFDLENLKRKYKQIYQAVSDEVRDR